MVVITSVFLVQLLCVIVPCDPRYPLPDLSPDPHKINSLYHKHNSFSQKDFLKKQGTFWNSLKRKKEDYHEDEDIGFNLVEKTIYKKELPYVQTKSGDIEGYFMKVVGGRDIAAFEGIPYAEPPEMFKLSVPKKPWKGVLHAKGEAEGCLQYNVPRIFRILGTQNCLYLNCYSSHIPTHLEPKPKLPVIVFIHGGGFFFGSTRVYGPSYFMQKDIVMCAMQYRLGVMGFMSSGDSASPGNYGLKDQVLAMKWIYDNVEFFGGDQSRITIMGQSAGSVFVHWHMLSKQSRPYFHRAVSLSGTAFNYWGGHNPWEARNLTASLAARVGCPTKDSFEMVECLRNTNPIKLVAKTPLFLDDWPYPSNAFRPCIETVEGNPYPFVTESPLEIYAKNEVAKIPWIVTTVSGEGYSFLLFPYVTFLFQNVLRKNWYNLFPDLVDIDSFEGVDFGKVTEKLAKFYFRKESPEKAPIHPYAKMVTDRTFLTGVYKAAQAHSQIAPTYSYVFDVNGQYNAIINYGYPASEWGVGHAEDIFYIFNSTLVYHGFNREDPEFKISQFMVNVIVNFAAKGEPVYTTDEGEDVLVWSPHNGPKDLNFLKIGLKKAKMVGDPFKKRIKFWENLAIPDTPTEEDILSISHYIKNKHGHVKRHSSNCSNLNPAKHFEFCLNS